MSFHRLVNKAADAKPPVDMAQLERDYFRFAVDIDPQRHFVQFGTCGHQGSSADGSFTEAHVFAITQAICDYRRSHDISGPVYIGRSTHCLSRLAQRNALETLAGNNIQIVLQPRDGVTPSPVISWSVLVYNRRRRTGLADGIVIAPTNNFLASGGIKYHSPTGPADRATSKWIQDRANELFREGLRGVKRSLFSSAIRAASTHEEDFITAYTNSLDDAIDLNSIRAADLNLAVDPMGGATLPYWERIRDTYRLKITLVNPKLDQSSGCTSFGEERKARINWPSQHSLRSLLPRRDRYAISIENNPCGELLGLVTKSSDMLRPDEFLAVAIQYLLTNRPVWPAESLVGKTFLASALIDRVANQLNRRIAEVPGGFHWFAPGLLDGTICFGADECGGATFLCKDGSRWTMERDGILLGLLAAEITARTGKEPGCQYQELARTLGNPCGATVEVPLEPERKQLLQEALAKSLIPGELAGEPVLVKFNRAPANNESIGGLKVVTAHGWLALSTTDATNNFKLSIESFIGQSHVDALLMEARQMIDNLLHADSSAERNRTG